MKFIYFCSIPHIEDDIDLYFGFDLFLHSFITNKISIILQDKCSVDNIFLYA